MNIGEAASPSMWVESKGLRRNVKDDNLTWCLQSIDTKRGRDARLALLKLPSGSEQTDNNF